jgi:hypothetical protein
MQQAACAASCPTGSGTGDVPLHVRAQLHGGNIQPFDFADRAALLHGLDDAIAAIRLENIELLAVEEILPASGPSSESLTSLLNDGNGAGPPPKGAPAAPPPTLPLALPPATTRALAPANSACLLLLSMQRVGSRWWRGARLAVGTT